jgi:pimeloyl-ACP methyl ester carboxylesterase
MRRQVRLGSGRRLGAVIAGDGEVDVVFLAGFMAGANEWSAVQRLLAGEVCSVSYDRAGYGDSDAPFGPPTERAALADLLELLEALEITAPVVFVAHSWGGTLLRLVASEHPERIAGLCLVDTTRTGLISAAQLRAQSLSLRVMAALAFAGLPRLVIGRAFGRHLEGMLPDEQTAFLSDSSALRTLRAGLAEKAQMSASGLALLAELEAQGLPDLPVTWVVGRQVDAGSRRARAGMLSGHQRECDVHPRARFVVAEQSGHLVPQQQPDLVAREVLHLVQGRDRA